MKLKSLSNDLLYQIFSFLEKSEVFKFRRLNTDFKDVKNIKFNIRKLTMKTYGRFFVLEINTILKMLNQILVLKTFTFNLKIESIEIMI
jgi:hypothetical protein